VQGRWAHPFHLPPTTRGADLYPAAEIRARLRGYAKKHSCHGSRRAWAALRVDERRQVNTKKIHRLWREEGLLVQVHRPRKRAGVSLFHRWTLTRRMWCGDRFPVRLHHGRQGHQARFDDR
jgi:hypothetical protein